jgi:hypothetical protein
MGKAQDRFKEMREGLDERARTLAEDDVERARDRAKALYDLANDLTYPTDTQGNQYNVHALIPVLSAHLEACGYRKHEELASIVQIPHPRRGHAQVVDDAVLYVPVESTGTVPSAFVPTPEEQPNDPVNDQWRTKTHITLNGDTIKGGP